MHFVIFNREKQMSRRTNFEAKFLPKNLEMSFICVHTHLPTHNPTHPHLCCRDAARRIAIGKNQICKDSIFSLYLPNFSKVQNFGKVELRENSAGDSCFRRNDEVREVEEVVVPSAPLRHRNPKNHINHINHINQSSDKRVIK